MKEKNHYRLFTKVKHYTKIYPLLFWSKSHKNIALDFENAGDSVYYESSFAVFTSYKYLREVMQFFILDQFDYAVKAYDKFLSWWLCKFFVNILKIKSFVEI